jgi:hypothetical protein
MPILVMIAISIALSLLAYMLMPKPKQPKPPAATDMESPTADAGRPVPVIFGECTVTGVNILGYWDKALRTYRVKV